MPRQSQHQRPAAVLLLAGLGCGPGDALSTWRACGAKECRASAIEAAFAQAPATVLADVSAMHDPIEQTALVHQLSYAFPDAQAEICAAVPPGSPARQQCDDLELRPHLYVHDNSAPTHQPPPRTAPGPDSNALPGSGLSPLPQVEPTPPTACGSDSPCLAEAAAASAAAGRPDDAATLCRAAWPAESMARAECVYEANRQVTWSMGAGGLEPGLRLCAESGALQVNCVHRALTNAMPAPTSAAAPDPDRLRAARRATEQAQAIVPGNVGASYADYMWSTWAWAGVAAAPAGWQVLQSALPPAAAPHVRAAAAWTAVRDAKGCPDIDAAADALMAIAPPALEPAAPPPLPERTHELRPDGPKLHHMWNTDILTEAQVPAVWFLAAGRRTTSADPRVDLQISLLEASGRLGLLRDPTCLAPALEETRPVALRWTAARLYTSLFGALPDLAGAAEPTLHMYALSPPPRLGDPP